MKKINKQQEEYFASDSSGLCFRAQTVLKRILMLKKPWLHMTFESGAGVSGEGDAKWGETQLSTLLENLWNLKVKLFQCLVSINEISMNKTTWFGTCQASTILQSNSLK